MNKGELISAIAQASGPDKSCLKKALDATIKGISDFAKGDKVTLVGFRNIFCS